MANWCACFCWAVVAVARPQRPPKPIIAPQNLHTLFSGCCWLDDPTKIRSGFSPPIFTTTVAATTVTVDNNAPSIDSISVSPSSQTVTSTHTCNNSVSDDDGTGSLTYSFVWTNMTGGTQISSGTSSQVTLTSSDVTKGDQVKCKFTLTDVDGATDFDTATEDIENTRPVVSGVAITPTSGLDTSDKLTCTVTSTDEDPADTGTYTYVWSVEGTAVKTHSNQSSARYLVKPTS